MKAMSMVRLLILAGAAAFSETKAADLEKVEWTAATLKSIDSIKPGMTRAEMLKTFTTEGGISSRRHRVYVLRECPYIKVEVEFAPAKPSDAARDEDPSDQIVSVSRPFLQWSVRD